MFYERRVGVLSLGSKQYKLAHGDRGFKCKRTHGLIFCYRWFDYFWTLCVGVETPTYNFCFLYYKAAPTLAGITPMAAAPSKKDGNTIASRA